MSKTSDMHLRMTEEAREAGREARENAESLRDATGEEPASADEAWSAELDGGHWGDILAILTEDEAREAFTEGYAPEAS